jgi:hypothetical protein
VSQSAIDPYGGLRERWTVGLLDEASQGAGIVFDKPAIRPMPATNQIDLVTRAHFEACGPTTLAAGAVSVGYITLGQVVDAAVDGCRWLGEDSVAKNGTGTKQLLNYARHRGWAVHEDDRRAGTLALDLVGSGHIGISALQTAYGTGASWNTLHPQASGHIGHWEGFGAVDGPLTEGTMDPAREESWNTWAAWEMFVELYRRVGDKDSFPWLLGLVRSDGPANALWKLLAMPEYVDPQKGGGEIGEIARLRAELDALKAEFMTDEQAEKVAAAGQAAWRKHVDDMASTSQAAHDHATSTTPITTSSTAT